LKYYWRITKYFKRKEFTNIPSIQLVKELDCLRISTGHPIFIKNNELNMANIKNKFYGEHPYNADESRHYSKIEAYGRDNDNYIAERLLHSKTMSITEKIITIALMQVGFKEGVNNDNPFGAFFNTNNASWCSFFVHWVLVKAGLITKEDLTYSFGLARQTFTNFAMSKTDPTQFSSGEMIVWGKKDSWQGHIGLVLVNDRVSETIYTIEGNISNKVKIKKYAYDKLNYGHYEFLGVGNLKSVIMDQLELSDIFAKYESIEENKNESTR